MNKKIEIWIKKHIVDDEPVEVTRVVMLLDMSFKQLIASLKRGVTREELRRAERG